MKPDLVLQWCVYCDYPLFRLFVQKYRDRFNKVILYPSRQHGVVDLEAFTKDAFKETWVDPVEIDYGTQDWRQAETMPCLDHLESDWVWFMEQDFFVSDWPKLFEDFDTQIKGGADMLGLWNNTHFPYMHPCCLLMRKELLDETNKDFSAHPEINGADHFSMLTRDAERLGAIMYKLTEDFENYFHLGGLTYPFQNWKGNGRDHFGVKNVEAYYVCMTEARKADVVQSPDYIKLSLEIEAELKRRYPDTDLENNKWRKFYAI